jgi:small conductance mechanosensitive channel
MDTTEYSALAIGYIMSYGPALVFAIVTLIVGLWVVSAVVSGTEKALDKGGMEPTLRKFLLSLTSIGLKALLLISVASMVGIETTSFIAVLGAAGLAIGLALQGSLANFAGGVLLLIFKPYKVGDFVEAAGVAGVVRGIEIFNTVITTGDNKTVIVPNGAVSNSPITNYSTQATRRVDIVFGIGYDDDLKKAKSVLESIIAADARILTDPAPMVVISNLGDNSVDITTRSWVNAADYWGVYFDLVENVKLTFDEQGISFPFPQRDVHLYKSVD